MIGEMMIRNCFLEYSKIVNKIQASSENYYLNHFPNNRDSDYYLFAEDEMTCWVSIPEIP
jgi:hypothetical protein